MQIMQMVATPSQIEWPEMGLTHGMTNLSLYTFYAAVDHCHDYTGALSNACDDPLPVARSGS